MILDKKVIIVTGGAGLLGREIAKDICLKGGICILTDISFKEVLSVSSHIENTYPYVLDITSKQSCEELLQEVFSKFGRIDGLVNSAYPRNKNYGRKFEEVKLEDFNDNVSMNLGGYFLMSQLFSMFFKEKGNGSIVNISSIYGVVAPKFEIYEETSMTMPVEYSVIKSGLIHLTKYIAAYMNGANVRVNCVSPGGLLNGQSEVFIKKYRKKCINKGMLDASDIVGSVSFLLSDDAKYINGQNIIVDDGFCL